MTGVCSNPPAPDGEFPGSQTTNCGVGACARTGRTICSSGEIIDTCIPGVPAPTDTTCDGSDDNCDGETDEGYVGHTTSCGSQLCTATGVTQCIDGQEMDTCVVPVCEIGSAGNPGTSCRQILAARQMSLPDGIYYIREGTGAPYPVYCDMTTDGGGWTAVFVGKNGSPNVFDHFDAAIYQGTFVDPSTKYLRHAPAWIAGSTGEIAVSCGGAMVSFAMTEAAREYLTTGTQADWIKLTPRVLVGSPVHIPNRLYTGNGSNYGFIFSEGQTGGVFTFASSYSTNTSFNYCNGVSDTTSIARVFFRETPPAPVHNTPATARRSCRAILLAGLSLGDGVYWLREDPQSTAYQAYCDMTTDGGGWTAVFAGRNGSPNVFGHFDAGAYTEICPDPAHRCVRRAPPSLGESASEVAVRCKDAMVSFPMTEATRAWMQSGTQNDWIGVTPRVLQGMVAEPPTALFTGNGGNRSFIFSAGAALGGVHTFASSYDASSSYDNCNGGPDQVSLVRVYYREAAPAPVHNTPATARRSCRAILDHNESLGDGLYWLRESPSDAPYQAYCDMTTDGGGWTAVFAGYNGSPNVFDHFDAPAYAGICTDPATHCLRRAPPSLANSASELAVTCGGAFVAIATTEPARKWLGEGVQSGWTNVTPRVVVGTVPRPPDRLYTGAVDNPSFIFSQGTAGGINVFASSYDFSSNYDGCNGVIDRASLVRVYYREVAPTPVRNSIGNAQMSCAVLRAMGHTEDGLYYLQDPGAPEAYLAYCDMTTDGGGWTAVFAGRNGSTNVFDHFDQGYYVGTCPDPASRCVRRAPAWVGSSATEFAASCGGATVTFALTNAARDWMTLGTQNDWIPVTPTIVEGAPTNVPDRFYTGVGGNRSFIFAKGELGGVYTFASSYEENANFDSCANVTDTSSKMRVYFRETLPQEPLNMPQTARASCKMLRSEGATLDGVYWIDAGTATPYKAYCDMTTDGGGWTAFFAGRNGQPNVFDHFDAAAFTGTCTDPATRCLRRTPASFTSGDFAVACGGAMFKFAGTTATRDYFASGTQGNWVGVTPSVIAGTIAKSPNTVFTGSGSNYGVIFAHGQLGGINTFASSHATTANFDYCNGVADQASVFRIFYREP
jgi:hypothetical protein